MFIKISTNFTFLTSIDLFAENCTIELIPLIRWNQTNKSYLLCSVDERDVSNRDAKVTLHCMKAQV